jgi:hypothetical protein
MAIESDIQSNVYIIEIPGVYENISKRSKI